MASNKKEDGEEPQFGVPTAKQAELEESFARYLAGSEEFLRRLNDKLDEVRQAQEKAGQDYSNVHGDLKSLENALSGVRENMGRNHLEVLEENLKLRRDFFEAEKRIYERLDAKFAAQAPYPVQAAPVPVYRSPYPQAVPFQPAQAAAPGGAPAEPPQYFKEAVRSIDSLAGLVRQLLEKDKSPEPDGGGHGGSGEGYHKPDSEDSAEEGAGESGKGTAPEYEKGEERAPPPIDRDEVQGSETGNKAGNTAYESGAAEEQEKAGESAEASGAQYATSSEENAAEPENPSPDEANPEPENSGTESESLEDVVEGDETKASEESSEEPADFKEKLYQIYEKAKELRKGGYYAHAVELLNIIGGTGKFEEVYKLYTEIGVMQLMEGSYDAAEKTFSMVLQTEGVSDDYRAIAEHNLGFIKEETGDLEGAKQYGAIEEGSLDTVEILYGWMPPEPKPEAPQTPEPADAAAKAA